MTAASLDFAHKHPDEAVRKEHRAFVEFMIPIVKGWCTETAVEICSTALQVFGGMGFIEETGIAQQYRDVRITSIYEGTTGIQALDLVGRKLIRDMGATATEIVGKTMAAFAKSARRIDDPDVNAIGEALREGGRGARRSVEWIGMNAMGDLHAAFACSVPYLKLWGIVAGGWQMARAAQIAAAKIAARRSRGGVLPGEARDRAFLRRARALRKRAGCKHEIVDGSGDVMALAEDAFDLDRKMRGRRRNRAAQR